MDLQQHWESVYRTRSPEQTSWYQPHLRTSLDWITAAAPDHASSIVDIGGGESTLVDDLLAGGYSNLTVLDLSETAVRKSQTRLGAAGQGVHWLAGDVTKIPLSTRGFDLWHDRAVFHFLTEQQQRAAYVRQLISCLHPGGHAILATFGPDGPQTCSGLPVRRYSAQDMQNEFGPQLELEESAAIDHRTPFGTTQQFVYCRFRLARTNTP